MRTIVGYPIHKANSPKNTKKGDALLCLHIYTFKNRKGTIYIVNVEQYLYDVYIIKFHTKADRSRKEKYNLLTNQKDARRIIYTCIEIGLQIYVTNPNASFGFVGSPIPKELKRESQLKNTKRFRVYSKFAKFFFSPDNFLHTNNPDFSLYLLLNKKHLESNNTLHEKIMEMFEQHFDLSDLLGNTNN